MALKCEGFFKPTKIQEFTSIALLADPPQNAYVQSQSGSGKMLASIIAMLSRVDAKLSQTQAICVTFSYEIAKQIGGLIKSLARYMNIQIGYALIDEQSKKKCIRFLSKILFHFSKTFFFSFDE